MEIKTKFELGQKVYAVNPPVNYESSHKVRAKSDSREWTIQEVRIYKHENSDIDGISTDIEYRVYDGEVVALFQEGELVATLQEWWTVRLDAAIARVEKIKGIINDLGEDI